MNISLEKFDQTKLKRSFSLPSYDFPSRPKTLRQKKNIQIQIKNPNSKRPQFKTHCDNFGRAWRSVGRRVYKMILNHMHRDSLYIASC